MARKASNAEQRAQLIMMAETWEELAAEREKRLRSQWSSPETSGDLWPDPSSSQKPKPATESGSRQ